MKFLFYMKAFLLVCFSAATSADQPEYGEKNSLGYDYLLNDTAYYDYYGNFSIDSNPKNYSEEHYFEKNGKIFEITKANATTEISDVKSPTAIPTEGGTRNKLPPNRKTISCETWTAQVLDCSDRNRQNGQKGEKGDRGKDSKGEAGVTGEVGVEGLRGPGGGDGGDGRDGRHGNEGRRGEEGEAGPGCDEEGVEEMRKRNKIMEEEFEEARRDQEWAEEEYEELKSSHDEVQHLLYRFMGGLT